LIPGPSRYDYDKGWFDHHIPSSHFEHALGHRNPSKFSTMPSSHVSRHVKIGGFKLGKNVKERFEALTPITKDMFNAIKDIKVSIL